MTASRLVTELLIKGLRAGDEASIANLFQRYYEELLRRTNRRVPAQMQAKIDAEGILQSAFRTFWDRARKGQFEIRSGENIVALLVCISQRKLLKKINWWLSAGRDQEISVEELGEFLDPKNVAPEDEAALNHVVACVRNKRPEGAEVLEKILQGHTSAEIEDDLKVSNYQVRKVREALLACINSSLQASSDTQ